MISHGRTSRLTLSLKFIFGAFFLLFSAALANATDLLVGSGSSSTNSSVIEYSGASGAFVKALVAVSANAGMSSPRSMAWGPDRNLYVGSYNGNSVLRFDGTTGAFMGAFVGGGVGGLSRPLGLRFGPDGNLYVSSSGNHQILKYNGSTGASMGVFASGGDLNTPRGLTFGSDGNLYVSSFGTSSVLRYDGGTGAFIDSFVTSGSGGLANPTSLSFGPDGNLYVASYSTSSVLRYNGSTGVFIDTFSSGVTTPESFVFGPDQNIYVASAQGNNVLRFSGTTGQLMGTFVSSGNGSLLGPKSLLFTLPPPNRTPIANAGADQSVNEGSTVTLDGSSSSDPDGDTLSYNWIQVSGPAVTLNLSNPAHPTFVAPNVGSAGASLSFDLTVDDGHAKRRRMKSTLATNSDSVTITVKNVNQAPIAQAGPAQSVNEGASVTLDGSSSYDADGDTLTYTWTQVSGPSVSLNTSNPVKPTFTAPAVGPTGAALSFQLVVNDGVVSSTADTLAITVNNVNSAPIANAGPDQQVDERTLVTLDASGSTDTDGDTLTYTWSQVSGPTVNLNLTDRAHPSFTAPEVARDGATLVFELVVNDGLKRKAKSKSLLAQSQDTVTINVRNVNRTAIADAGSDQSVDEGQSVSLSALNSTDPDGDTLTYTWTQSSGPSVNIAGANTALASFTAPNVGVAGATLSFSVLVSDGLASATDSVVVNVRNVNLAPVANAGTDQSVNELTTVSLDGSTSSDPDGDALTYTWKQIAGPAVSLTLVDPAHPKFTAPDVPIGGATLTFELTVSDGALSSARDSVNVVVKSVNKAPVADAGTDQTVSEGTGVMLDASSSYDPDGDALIYTWTQTSGPAVVLADATTAHPSFTAPTTSSSAVTLEFSLVVNDGATSSLADTVSVVVENVNHAPNANAGSPQTIDQGTTVTLDGSSSSDPDGDPLIYTWVQVAGPQVQLDLLDPVHPQFVAPSSSANSITLSFKLVVNDGLVSSQASFVTITAVGRQAPPVCNLAHAKNSTLWPPDHKLLANEIEGVSDPSNLDTQVTILSITQDEPVNGTGDGDTGPDAVTQGEQFLLRAERKANGDGRVYQVRFRAENSAGASCTGAVTVCVPQKARGSCTDSGQNYSSLK